MKQDTLILLGGLAVLAVGGYFLISRQGLTQKDQQIIQQEAADDQSAQMMAMILQEMKNMNKNVPAYDPWDDPNTYAKFAEMGVQLVTGIIGAAV